MKEEFLKNLEERLKEENVNDADEILKKYEKRYNFGIESGLSEEEIENMLGSIEEIVKLHKVETRYEYKDSYGQMKLSISTVTDNVQFERSKDDTIHVYLEKIDENSYEITKTDKEITVSYMNKKFFGLNRRKPGLITIAIPEGFSFSRMKLSTVSGDFTSDIDIDSEYFMLEMVNGDSELTRVKSKEFTCHVVSGDLEADEINTSRIQLSTVSGDIDIEKLAADELQASSISGDIKILEAYESMKVKASSISGEIRINEHKYKNFTGKMEEF